MAEYYNLPKQVWALLRKWDGGLVPPNDDDGTTIFLAWPDEESARIGLAYQQDTYDVEAEIVRLL
jgi:hypothetical protein